MSSTIYVIGTGVKRDAHLTMETSVLLPELTDIVHLHDAGLREVPGGPRLHDLSSWYAEGRDRTEVYAEVVGEVLRLASRPGARVGYLTTGNAVFLNAMVAGILDGAAPRGIQVRLLSGVSTLDTLLTDLRLPVERLGLQCFLASHFIARRGQPFDASVPLFLFQPGTFSANRVRLTPLSPAEALPLTERLLEVYPQEQRWILAISPERVGTAPKFVHGTLASLQAASARLIQGTLVIPGGWWPGHLS